MADHLIRYYVDKNLVVLYIRPAGQLIAVRFLRWYPQEGQLVPVRVPYENLIRSTVKQWLRSGQQLSRIFCPPRQFEESHLLVDPGPEIRIRRSLQAVSRASLQFRKDLQSRSDPWSVPDPQEVPGRRKLYCRNSRQHGDLVQTGPLHSCFLQFCPCQGRGYIGHCPSCGNLVHECPEPSCYWTVGSQTRFHGQSKNHLYHTQLRNQLRKHLSVSHETTWDGHDRHQFDIPQLIPNPPKTHLNPPVPNPGWGLLYLITDASGHAENSNFEQEEQRKRELSNFIEQVKNVIKDNL